jgi:DNA-binding IclR family transcriptional regulator
MAGGSTGWRGRSVVSKVASLLDAFSPSSPQLSLGELAERSGLPMSTTYRLAMELVAWGALERADAGAGYRLGSRLRELAALAPHRETVGAIAQPFLEDLHEATQGDVHLAVLDGSRARYTKGLAQHLTEGRPPPVLEWCSDGLPLHATSAGKVLLAHAPQVLLDEVLTADLPCFTPHTVTGGPALRRALDDVRRTGLAYEREELALGQQSVAAPVVGAGGSAVAAVAVVRPAARAGLVHLGPAVRTTAISISRALQERGTSRTAYPVRQR